MLSAKHIICPGLPHVQPYGATPAVAQDHPFPPSILLPPQQQALPHPGGMGEGVQGVRVIYAYPEMQTLPSGLTLPALV